MSISKYFAVILALVLYLYGSEGFVVPQYSAVGVHRCQDSPRPSEECRSGGIRLHDARPSNGGSGGSGGSAKREAKKEAMKELTQQYGRISPQDLRGFVETYGNKLNARDIATMVHALAKKRMMVPNDIMEGFVEVLQRDDTAMKVDVIYITKCFQGLRLFRDDVSDTLSTSYLMYLSAIIEKNSNQIYFDGQAIGQCMYAFQRFQSRLPGISTLLEILKVKINESRQELSGQNIGNALYGLQGMSSQESEVRAVLDALGRKIGESRQELDAQAIGNALYGLQGMSSQESEVRAVLDALGRKISKSRQELSGQNIGNALYGLLCLQTAGGFEVNKVVLSKFMNCLDDLVSDSLVQELSDADIRDLLRTLKLADLFVSPIWTEVQLAGKVERLLEVARSRGHDMSWAGRGSKAEGRFYRCIASLLRSHHLDDQYEVSCNEYLDSCFEADIVIRTVAGKSEPDLVCNIEIDGPSHLQPTTKRLCALRDAYLKKSCGVQIARIPLVERVGVGVESRGNSDGEIEAMARRALVELNILPSLDGERKGDK